MMATLAEIRQQHPEYGDLPDQQLADGLYKKFYSDIPRADFNRKIGLSATAPEGLRPGTQEYADWAGQQARAGIDLPQISNPNPEQPWDAPGSIVPIQFQQGTGAARLAVPSLVTDAMGAFQAPGKALQGGYDELQVNPESGAVSPFDPRMVDDAANLASMVSPISPASRIAPVAGALGQRTAKAATPEIDDLYAVKDAAYDTVDKLGARYSADAIDGLHSDMYRRLGEANIDPAPDGVHKATVRMLERLQDRQGDTSLTKLDQLRQLIRRDVVKSGSDGDAELGRHMIDAIDDFIDNAGPNQISGATGQTASFAIRTARKANATLRKSETLQDALDAARLRAASSGSGGNIDNAVRQELRKIILNPKKSMGFTKDELGQMERIVMGGGRMQDALRLVGKLSPSGNGLMAALGLGATATNPLLAIAPAAGMVAKTIADRATKTGVEGLTNTVRNGGAVPPPLPGRGLSAITPKASTTLIEQNIGPKLLNFPAKAFVRLGA